MEPRRPAGLPSQLASEWFTRKFTSHQVYSNEEEKPYVTRCHVRLYEVDRRRIELPTSALRTQRSPS